MISRLKIFLFSIGAIAAVAEADVLAESPENSSVYIFTNSSGEVPASETVINSAYYDFYIPPSDELPAGSRVKIKSISLSGFNASYVTDKTDTSWADSAFVNLNGVRSDPVNGGSVSSSRYSDGDWGEVIASGSEVNGTLLKYDFSSDCVVVVGKRYPASSIGNQGGVGYGITLLHANGKANGGGGNNFVSATAVRFIKTDNGDSIVSFAGSVNDGLYPVYSIELELVEKSVFWTGEGSDHKMSNGNNWSTGEVPQGGNIGIDSRNGDITIELDCERSVESLVVTGNGAVTFIGTEGGNFTVAKLVVGAPTKVNCVNFHPQEIEFARNGVISIGEQGRLSDIVFSYTGSLPTVGSAFSTTTVDSKITDPDRWGGTIWLRNISVSNFNPNNYGHGSTESMPASTVRLSGIEGFFPKKLRISPVLELKNDGYECGLKVTDGYSRKEDSRDNIIEIEKLEGEGAFWTTDSNAITVLFNIKDYSAFSGPVQLVKQIVVFGANVPNVEEFNTAGSIYIGTGVEATIPNSAQWRADGGIHVKGVLNVADAVNDRIRSGTRVVTYDTGIVNLTNVSEARWNFDYSRIQGSGTLCFAGSGWCSLTTNNTISASLTIKNEQIAGLVIPPNTRLEDGTKNYVCEIGSFAGSKNLRGDYNWTGEGNSIRSLRIKQSKDTEWSGIVKEGAERVGEISVAPGELRAGTLTLSGTAQNNVRLKVESGARVKITGKWKGNVTVGGTLSGTGEVEGAVSFGDGSSIVVSTLEDFNDPLMVTSADFAGTVTLDLPEGTTSGTVLQATGTGGEQSSVHFIVKTGGKVRSGVPVSIRPNANGGSDVRVNLMRFFIRIR